jgi:hypothetical protein
MSLVESKERLKSTSNLSSKEREMAPLLPPTRHSLLKKKRKRRRSRSPVLLRTFPVMMRTPQRYGV